MSTSKISTTEGTGKNIATFSFSEDALTKEIQRSALTNSAGTEIGTSSNPVQVTGANGTFPATQSGTWTMQPGNTPNTSPWLTTSVPATSGGFSVYSGSIGNTPTSVKSSAGQVYGWYIYNSNSSAVYVQIFNVASGSVTLGTTAPTYSLGIPATGGANVFLDNGIAHSTAISIGITTTRAGSTNPSNTVDVNIFYK